MTRRKRRTSMVRPASADEGVKGKEKQTKRREKRPAEREKRKKRKKNEKNHDKTSKWLKKKRRFTLIWQVPRDLPD